MINSISEAMKTRFVLAAIGLVQGFLYYLSYEFWPDGVTSRALVAAGLFLVSGFVLTFHLSWTGDNIKRLFAVASAIPLVLAVLAFWVWRQVPVADVPYLNDGVRAPTLVFAGAVTLFLVLPAIQVFQETGRRPLDYGGMFLRLWENIFVVAAAGLVIWAFWAVILLWSELFKLIDVTFFEDVFMDAAFVCMSLGTVFGYAVALGREWEKLTTTTRTVLFTILKALMPLLAVIALLFLVSLPFTGLQPLWDTRHASATLLALIGLTVLFFNGAYQDGSGNPPYSRWVRHLVEAAVAVIPIFAAITIYALHLRIAQYGLTFGRFYGVMFAVLSMLCGLGYAVAVFKTRGGWMITVRSVNLGLACVVILCAVLVHTPVLDPFRWSARNQFARLAGGEADANEFDFGYLRFQLGHVGWETLADLEALSDHPQADIIGQRVAATRNADSYYDVQPKPASLVSASDIVPLEVESPIPDSLVSFVVSNLTQYQADECEDSGECTIFGANLDSDAELEFVLVLSGERDYEVLAFDLDEHGNWDQVGRLRPYGVRERFPDRAAFLDSLRQVGPQTVEARYRDLLVGELRLRVTR